MKKVFAALSGGVDSAVTALMLKEEGFTVEGVTMCLCPGDDGSRAVAAAEKIGIPCHVLDYREDFRSRILLDSRREYLAGRTPNPCARCNREFKFGLLADFARENGGYALATGHYALLEKDDSGEVRVKCGRDREKNQVYFLALVRKDALAGAVLPLGGFRKEEVKSLAVKYGLENFAVQKESQDVCVCANGLSFPRTLAGLFPEESGQPGFIVDTAGKRLGTHPGLEYFTIGQRKGLGVAMGSPAYVTALDVERNQVVLSTDKNDLLSRIIYVDDMNFLAEDIFTAGSGTVQFRYRQTPVPAVWELFDDGRCVIELAEPLPRPAAGQVAAFYSGDILLAGGTIVSA